MIKAILFDMDGVLIDSEALILKAAIAGLREFGIETVPEDFTEFVGAGEDRYIGGPVQKYGGTFIPEMKTRVYEIYAQLLFATPDAVYDGVLDMLSSVKHSYFTAVCSAADFVKVNHNLHAIGVTPEFFGTLITGSDVKRQKPFPDIFLAAAERLDIPASECVVIEDSINGIKAAKAAGMTSIAVTTSFSREVLTEKAAPDYIIDDIRKLPELMKAL